MSILAWILWAVLSTTESSTINSTSLPPPQQLTVLNLNFWGLGWPWGSDKDVRLYQNMTSPVQPVFNFAHFRIQALREELVSGKYDIVLLQEIIHIIESEKFGSDQF